MPGPTIPIISSILKEGGKKLIKKYGQTNLLKNSKKLDPAGDIKKEKIKKERLKAAGVAVLGAVGISAAVKNIKNTLESEYGKNDKKKNKWNQ